jgi:peptidoglycan hydrolase-like protein with peptidoglycan-binding domain
VLAARKLLVGLLVALLWTWPHKQAIAQNASDVISLFNNMMRAAVVNQTRIEWSKLSPNETSCIDQTLQQQGYSIQTIIQNGILPNNPQIAGIRSSCRTAIASLPPPTINAPQIQQLSSRPTFDCAKARSATARIICLDQAGANADWDLISAYWARYGALGEDGQKAFDQAQQDWLDNLKQVCRLNAQQGAFIPSQQQCVLDAYRKRATAYRSQLHGDALDESRLTPEQRAEIQQSLIGLGFLSDTADGEFGALTRAAIKQFQRQSGFAETGFLTGQQRQQLRGGKQVAAAPMPDSEITERASRLSPSEAAVQCESSDTETRLIGCTAIINAGSGGKNSVVSLADALDGRCWAYNDLGQFERGLADCRASIAKAPRYSYAYNNLGTSLVGLGDTAKAIDAFTTSIELKPTFIYSYLGRAKAYVAVGNADLARKDFQYVLSIDPVNQQASDGIAALDNPGSGGAPSVNKLRPASAPKETPKIKEAHAFLADSKKFIADQKSVPAISAIATEAANLQVALDKADEAAAQRSVQSLNGLLKPIPGFDEFEQQQKAAREREETRRLNEARTEANRNIFFVDNYMKDHLGDPKTSMLLKLRGQLDGSRTKNTVDDINKANDTLHSYVEGNDLSDSYKTVSGSFSDASGTPADSRDLVERLGIGDKSRFLVEGSADDIILLYNSSQKAPNVWKNIRGDIVFQNDSGSLCFAQGSLDIPMARYIERTVSDRGAKSLKSVLAQCDLSSVGSTADIIALQRGEFLKSRDDYIVRLANMVEDGTFRELKIITDYPSMFQKAQTLALQIERDVETNQRAGYGVIAVSESTTTCVITPDPTNRLDGMKELLKRNSYGIAPKLTADWQFVEVTPDLAYLGLQRHQCGYVTGDAEALRSIALALRRDNVNYTFAAVWWDGKDVDQATFDVRDKTEQEIRKKAELERAMKEQQALDEQRNKKMEADKTEKERQFRQKNGSRVRGLMNDVADFVKDLAEKRKNDTGGFFASYSNWLNSRFADQWETYNVNSDVADFGTVQWDRRPLDAVIVKAVIQQKNRILGRYEDKCFMFGVIFDPEFAMERDPVVADCKDEKSINRWQVGESFQSQWNVR